MRIEYTAGLKYQLHKTVTIQTCCCPDDPILLPFISLATDGVLTIRTGFAWDGLSGPTYDTKNSQPGSLVHDALYKCLRSGKLDQALRADVDDEMRRILLEDGVWKFRVWYLWRAVRRMAAFAAAPENRRKIIRAGR